MTEISTSVILGESTACTRSIPSSAADREAVSVLRATLRSEPTQSDSGKTVLDAQRREHGTVCFSTSPFAHGKASGEWVTASGCETSAMILYLHGRRFQFEEPVETFAPRLSAATRLPVLQVRYRLAPRFHYPAAIEDVLAVYEALLTIGFDPARIVLVGHSAGATLALSASLDLAAKLRPLPACLVSLSAITDFTYSGASMTRNAQKDIISQREALQVRDAYLGRVDPSAAPQSPLYGDLSRLPPLRFVSGGDELFLDDCRRFVLAALRAGARASLEIYEDMPHAFAVMPLEASELVLRSVADFVRRELTRRQMRGSPGVRESGGGGSVNGSLEKRSALNTLR